MSRRLTLLLAAPNWLGDLVMATSLFDLFALGESRYGIARPDLVISLRRRWRPLFESDDRLSGLIDYARTGEHGGWRGVWRQARLWRDTGARDVIVLPPSLRAGAVARLCGARTRIGFRGDGRDRLLTHPVDRPARGACHYTEELTRLYRTWAEACGVGALPDVLPVPAPRLPGVDALDAPEGAADGPPLWVVAVSSTYGDAKTWPARRVAALVDRILSERDARVVMIGDEAAREAAAAVGREVGAPLQDRLRPEAGLYDLVGATTLAGLAGLLRDAEAFLGNDSGPMHLAAALGTPTVGIFGSSCPAWTRPRGPRATAVSAEGFACQPCFLKTCPEPTFCLDTLEPERVYTAACALLDEPGAGAVRHRVPDAPVESPAPVLFLDRDGVIIRDTSYISDPDDVVLLPGVAAALARARDAGLKLVVVTNQSGIGRGYYSRDDFDAVQARIDLLLAEAGVELDALYYCPHAPEAECNCRKPRPGMLDAAADAFDWRSDAAWMVGDKAADVRLGRQAGLDAYLVRTGQGAAAEGDLPTDPRVKVVDDLSAAVDDILQGRAS